MDWLWAFQAAVNALILVILGIQARKWGVPETSVKTSAAPDPASKQALQEISENGQRLNRQIQVFEQICAQARNALHRVQQSPHPVSEEERELLEWMSRQKRSSPAEELPSAAELEKRTPRMPLDAGALRAVLRDQNT